MYRVLIVFPTQWDRKQLAACQSSWQDQFEIIFAEPSDADCPAEFDILSFINDMADQYRGRIDGVFSSSDYPGATTAAAIATRLGLPGPLPQTVLQSSHKYYSRCLQEAVAPEATPWYRVIVPDDIEQVLPDLQWPCFVKPVKGAFSIMSRRVPTADELIQFLTSEDAEDFLKNYLDIFDRLMRKLTDYELGGRLFLAEELLHGVQVTIEGYTTTEGVQILGVVDSIMHSHTPSFACFRYPSTLPDHVLDRMRDITRRVMTRLGLVNSLFNIEFIYDAANDRISIIEINPRLCGQFADLYQKVDGQNSFELAMSLAVGRPFQRLVGQGPATVAASMPWRVFQPVRVIHAPDEHEVQLVEARHPGVLVWPECRCGDRLEHFEDEDGSSYRYAVVNLGAPDHHHLTELEAQLHTELNFTFGDTPPLPVE